MENKKWGEVCINFVHFSFQMLCECGQLHKSGKKNFDRVYLEVGKDFSYYTFQLH